MASKLKFRVAGPKNCFIYGAVKMELLQYEYVFCVK